MVTRWSFKERNRKLITSAQDQCIRTNNVKTKILQMTPNAECVKPMTKQFIPYFSECPKLLQKEYKRQHDWMGKAVLWDICRKKGFNVPDKWYEHKPIPCTENKSFKNLWDFNIQADNKIEHRRPDMIIIDKTSRKAQRVDFAVPADQI